ncbi:MAG: DNA internalization-related competence protein ComEC/Rec2 [Thermodesulfobacteriota bacterium]
MPPSPRLPRPLIYTLPFFLAGLAWGPELAALEVNLWPAALSAAGVLLIAAILKRGIGLIPLGLFFSLLGAAASISAFTPPADPGHVLKRTDEPLVFGGVIVESPLKSLDRTRLIIAVDEALDRDGRPEPASGRVLVTFPTGPSNLNAGDRVRFPAVLHPIAPPGNPGAFDYRRHQAGQGAWVQTFLKDRRLLMPVQGPAAAGSPLFLLSRLRARASDFLDGTMGQPALGLMKALLLGMQDEVEPGVSDAFRRLGLSHLLAISGLNLGLVALLAYWLFRRLLLVRSSLALRLDVHRLASLLALGVVILYTGLAGPSPSVHRAALMVGVYILAALIQRRHDPLTALAASAWIILIRQPGAVFLASFQLSFAAAAALIIFVPRLPGSPYRDQPDQEENPLRRWFVLWNLTVPPLVALLATAPIAAWHFNRLPLLGLPANMIFTPIISLVVTPAGLAALGLASFWPGAAAAVLALTERLWWLILPALEGAAAWPGLDPLAPRPGPLFFVAFYVVMAAVLLRPWTKAAVAAGLAAGCYGLTLLAGLSAGVGRPEFKVTILDVGQGAAIHLRFPDGTRMMLDGGGFPGSDFDPGERIIAPFLLSLGVTRLNILALSHPQADHAGGLPFLAREFHPDELWTNGAETGAAAYRELLTLAAGRSMKQPSLVELHRSREFGPARVQVLAPPPDYLSHDRGRKSGGRSNDDSLVLKVTMGSKAFLFPGDLEAEGEADLLRRAGDNPRADVLVAPHHGSAGSMSSAFLEKVRPGHVVFSVGRRNRFGLPSRQAELRARRIGARIYRTDLEGAVTFSTDGESLEVETHLNRE